IVAFENGADAVYVGLSKFNARERADNFTFEDLSKLLCFAHKNDKKVYVAFNTLVKESELPEAAEFLANLAEFRPDALIVQDLGIVNLARTFLPEVPIHASTQMAIHNSAGVAAAERMGITRVILERQVTRDELNMISRNSRIELEVFVHGALCCSLSGSCLFSSWLGGWSGNRGKCTQPCRRRFFSEDGNGFFFSAKDLASSESIPKLMKFGVSSFKIEGRLKKPDYIANVVSAYRMIIDEACEGGTVAPPKALEMISKTSSRSFSSGFSSKKAFKNIIEAERMGVTGSLCGTVIRPVYNGFMAEVSRRIHVGDILRIQKHAGDNSVSLAVSTITIDGEIVSKATTGDVCFIRCDREAPAGADIFKTGESFDKMTAKLANLPKSRREVNLRITLWEKMISVDSEEFGNWTRKIETQPAKKAPVTPETLDACFRASNSDTLAVREISAEIAAEYFIPASELKKTRREFWERCAELEPKLKVASDAKLAERIEEALEYINVKPLPPEDAGGNAFARKKSVDIFSAESDTEVVVLPPFLSEDKVGELKRRLEVAVNDHGIREFRVTSLYQIPLMLKFKDVKLAVSFPFPVCNNLAVREIGDLLVGGDFDPAKPEDGSSSRLTSVEAWVELEEREIHAMVESSPVPVEMLVEGHIPILVTRAEVPIEGRINDDRGANYFVQRDSKTGITYIYSERPLELPLVKGAIPRKTGKLPEFPDVNPSTFNFNRELV
ncbi:MAG: U32 family peptidase, partial [Victivallales bacterium]|nr:U32 family peptidase [Victivallales bacterium]